MPGLLQKVLHQVLRFRLEWAVVHGDQIRGVLRKVQVFLNRFVGRWSFGPTLRSGSLGILSRVVSFLNRFHLFIKFSLIYLISVFGHGRFDIVSLECLLLDVGGH